MAFHPWPHWVRCSDDDERPGGSGEATPGKGAAPGGPSHKRGAPHPGDGHAQWSTRPGFVLAAIGPLLLAAGLLAPWWGRWLPDGREPGPAAAWAIVLVGLVWIVWTFGWWWRRTWRGAVVTGRNVGSLSLLQATAWTVLLVSLVVAVAAWSAAGLGGRLDEDGGRPDEPLQEVAAQVGAVAVTSAAAVGITAGKKRRRPAEQAMESIAKADVARRPERHAARLAAALGAGTAKAAQPVGKASATALAAAQRERERASDQARLVLGRLGQVGPARKAIAAAPAGDGKAAEAAAVDPQLLMAAAATALTADEMTRWSTSLLQGRVPDAWDDLRRRIQAELGQPLPPIDQVRDILKRYAQAAALGDVARARTGSVFRNACACQARFTDMLEGDEVADHESKDSSKIQFLVVTLGSLAAMVLWCWRQMDGGGFSDAFLPGLPEGMTILSSATAAGYLGGKLPQRTPVEGLLP